MASRRRSLPPQASDQPNGGVGHISASIQGCFGEGAHHKPSQGLWIPTLDQARSHGGDQCAFERAQMMTGVDLAPPTPTEHARAVDKDDLPHRPFARRVQKREGSALQLSKWVSWTGRRPPNRFD